MLKKVVIIGLLVLCATTAFADQAGNSDQTVSLFKPSAVQSQPKFWGEYIDTTNYPNKDAFNHFYVQLGGGIAVDLFRFEQQPTEIKHTYDAVNGFAAATLGAGWKLDVFYLGFAADGIWNFAKYTKSIGSSYKELSIPYSLGAYFIPGAFLTDHTMLYLKIGGVWSKFKVATNDPSTFNINSFSTQIFGGRAGLGLRVYLNQYFSIDSEYDFTLYENLHKQYNGYTTKYLPISNQFSLGLAVHF